MIDTEIKFDFKQIEYGLLGFIGNLQLKLQKIIPKLPVFILQSGETSYIIDKKFKQTENKEIYEKIPRVVLTLEDIQPVTEQETNKYNKFYYDYEGCNYQCSGRRIALTVPIIMDFISPNFLLGLQNYIVALTFLKSYANVFTYDFCGSTYDAGYALQSTSSEKPVMDFGNGTKNTNMRFNIDLQLQILVPMIESIVETNKTEYDDVQFSLTTKGKTVAEDTTHIIKLTDSDE